MSENQEKPAEGGMSFGINADTKVKNTTPFSPGIYKGYLTEVKQEEIGKDKKFNVLIFVFRDELGDRTYRHSEFPIEDDAEKRDVRLQGLYSRIGHIFTAFAPMPQEGLGTGATSFQDFFSKVANSFNTGNAGKPVFVREEADKKFPVSVWLKLTVDKKDNIGFPMSPNFIERIKAESANVQAARTLVIDKKFDKMEQSGNQNKATTGVMGGAATGAIAAKDDFNF
jgi:hypothetical protein